MAAQGNSNARSVFVTGATGFFGSHIARAFLDAGWWVWAVVRSSSDATRLDRLAGGAPTLRRVCLDLREKGRVAAALTETRPSMVVHCAAYGVDYRQQDPEVAIATNIVANEHLIQAAADAGVARFVHVGTSAEYGDHETAIDEDQCLRPRSVYGATKAAASLIALGCAGGLGLPLVVIRPFAMYGPLEGEHKFVPMVMGACREGRTLDLSPGEQVRDYTFVGDVAQACMLLATVELFPAGEIVNLGSGVPLTLRELAEATAAAVGGDPSCLRWGGRDYRSDEIMFHLADPGKAAALLRWQATTPLAEGMRVTARWHAER